MQKAKHQPIEGHTIMKLSTALVLLNATSIIADRGFTHPGPFIRKGRVMQNAKHQPIKGHTIMKLSTALVLLTTTNARTCPIGKRQLHL